MRYFLLAFLAMSLTTTIARADAIPVAFERDDDGWQLTRGGEPHVIKGAGTGGMQAFEELAAAGGNSIRTWGIGPETRDLLDKAHAHGLTVTLGLWVKHPGSDGQPNDYRDPEYVKAIRADLIGQARQMVRDYGDHPALLMYSIGNEAEIGNNVPAYWETINVVAEAVKEMDAHHPVITITADLGDAAEPNGTKIARYAPALDAWGINSYGGLFSIKERRAAATEKGLEGMDGPFLMTEFGPLGQWEVGRKPWGTPVEQTSTVKAAQYADLYRKQIAGNPDCVGSYVFFWDNKQEATKTWFSMFLPDGRPTETIDAMHKVWTGNWPENRAPTLKETTVSIAGDDPVKAGDTISAEIVASDPDNDELTYEWSVRRASEGGMNMGRYEDRTELMDVEFKTSGSGESVTFAAPTDPGAYRLFVIVTDGDKVAYANWPFHVGAYASR